MPGIFCTILHECTTCLSAVLSPSHVVACLPASQRLIRHRLVTPASDQPRADALTLQLYCYMLVCVNVLPTTGLRQPGPKALATLPTSHPHCPIAPSWLRRPLAVLAAELWTVQHADMHPHAATPAGFGCSACSCTWARRCCCYCYSGAAAAQTAAQTFEMHSGIAPSAKHGS